MIVALGALLVGAGILLAVLARESARRRRVRDLRVLLDLQLLDAHRPDDPRQTSSLLARSGLAAERAFGEAGVLARVRSVLDRSDWTLSAGEFAVVSLAVAAVAGLVGALTTGPAGGVVAALLALVAPYALVLRSVARRRRAFDEQFADVLDLVAASLESGASVTQALELVVDEADEPVAGEFGRVLGAMSLGATLPEALAAAGERLGSRDLDWTVQAITVQQRTGGRLADVLRIVARTMRERADTTRELHTLTTEGRLSAYVLGGLPFGLAGILLLVNPDYLSPLVHDRMGVTLLGVAAVLMVVGFAWMWRVVRVEV